MFFPPGLLPDRVSSKRVRIAARHCSIHANAAIHLWFRARNEPQQIADAKALAEKCKASKFEQCE